MGGKPKSTAKPSAKKRGRQSAGQSSTPNGGRAKKQRNSGNHRSDEVDASTKKEKSATSNHDNDLNSPNPDEYTDVLGLDEWMPPRVFDGAWEESVQTVETLEADNDGVLWVFLSWNEKNEEGRFLRNKVKAATCYRACPQKVCLHSVLARSSRGSPFLSRCWNFSKGICEFQPQSIPFTR